MEYFPNALLKWSEGEWFLSPSDHTLTVEAPVKVWQDGGPGLHFCPVAWLLAKDSPSPKGISRVLSLLFSAKQESDKNETSSCLQSVLRFMGKNHPNPSSNPYERWSKMVLTWLKCSCFAESWTQAEDAWCCLCLVFPSVLSNRKMWKTSEMAGFITGWEHLLLTGPVPVLIASEEDFSEQSIPAHKMFPSLLVGCKRKFEGLYFGKEGSMVRRVLDLSFIPCKQRACGYQCLWKTAVFRVCN